MFKSSQGPDARPTPLMYLTGDDDAMPPKGRRWKRNMNPTINQERKRTPPASSTEGSQRFPPHRLNATTIAATREACSSSSGNDELPSLVCPKHRARNARHFDQVPEPKRLRLEDSLQEREIYHAGLTH
jgi:hypothetical protein